MDLLRILAAFTCGFTVLFVATILRNRRPGNWWD